MTDAFHTETWPTYAEDQRKDLFWYERLWGVLLNRLENQSTPNTMGLGLLDYGCGPGFLVALAHRRGWPASGYDPSAKARADALDINNIKVLPEPDFRTFYGCVVMTEVLEHIQNPEHALHEAWKLLAHNGLLAISVPNDDNPLQSSGAKQPWVHDSHLHYLNPKSLRRLVENAGFDVTWQGSSFPVEVLLAIPFMPRKWAWKLSRLWPAPPVLWRFNIGRHALLVARKKS